MLHLEGEEIWLRALREVEVSTSFLLEIYLLIQGGAAQAPAQIIRLGPDPVSLSLLGVMAERGTSEPHS